MKNSCFVILVYSTSHAFRIEKLLKEKNIMCRMVTVPRHLSSDCGICLCLSTEDKELVVEIIDKSGIEIQGIFVI